MMMPDRIFDVDWGQVVHSVSRVAGTDTPASDEFTMADDNGTIIEQGSSMCVIFQEIDLEQLTIEGRVFTPKGIEVQRPWTAPIGQDWNFFPATRCYEYLYVFSNPLPNDALTVGSIEGFKDMGLDASLGGRGSQVYNGFQVPDNAQCIFAQNTVSVNQMANAASVWNGTLEGGSAGPPPVPADPYAPLMAAEMTVTEVNRWGSLPDIIGPKLYCYRVLFYPSQYQSGLSGGANPIVNATGFTARNHSSISIKIVCEEAKLSEGEYLTRAANAYNNANAIDPNRS